MLDAELLGGSLPSWLWIQLGSALGRMSGAVDDAGKVVGHSGDSPFDVNPANYFPDVPDAITIACFTNCTDKGSQSSQRQKLLMRKDGWIGSVDFNTKGCERLFPFVVCEVSNGFPVIVLISPTHQRVANLHQNKLIV